MANTKVIRLSFSAPVHFGDGRLSGGLCTCDAATLFSAMYIEAMKMGVQEDLLQAARTGALTISDAFPFVGDALYLPKPMAAPGLFERREGQARGDSRERKANKKLAYVSVAKYGDYLQGRFDAISELEQFNPGVSSLQAKVNLERLNGPDAEPYFVGGFSFNCDAGLYFLARGMFDLDPIMEQLGYSGIGGKRTSGYGRFTPSVSEAPELLRGLEPGTSATASVLLSAAAPKPGELTDELLAGSRYRLVRKSGFVQSASHSANPQKKRDLYVFAAGSVFSRCFDGDVFDVNATPGAHPVYRYARAFWMGV